MTNQVISRSFLFACLLALISCNKETDPNNKIDPRPEPTQRQEITVNFSLPSTKAQVSNGYFDGDIQTWEKDVFHMICYVVKEGTNNLVATHQFTDKEVEKMSATFVISNFTPDVDYNFYVVANTHFTPNNREEIDSLSMTDIEAYNGDFSTITTRGARERGFVMSGISKARVSAGNNTVLLDIGLKRIVSKYAIKMYISPTFTVRYPGELKFNRIEISKSSYKTTVFEAKPIASDYKEFSASQLSNNVDGEGQNLFYLFENGRRNDDEKVHFVIYAIYDEDRDFETINDQVEVIYQLAISKNGGELKRNMHYRHTIAINGLKATEFTNSISVQEWNVISSPGGLE